jgi:hypothetical protein
MSARVIQARAQYAVARRRNRTDVANRYVDLQTAKLLDAVDDALGKTSEAGYPFSAEHVEQIHAYVDERLASGAA